MLKWWGQFRESHGKNFQFCESCFFKKKKSVSHQKKFLYFEWYFSENHSSSHLFSKKDWILWRISKRKFKSSSHLLKKVQFSEFCESYFTRKFNSSSDNLEKFLWIILEKRVQFFESYLPKTINLFFESYQKNGVIFFDSCWKERFNLYEFF